MSETRKSDARLGELFSTGGDARIVIDPATRRNQYMSSPWPVATVAYASSTANDVSADAYAHGLERLAALAPDGALSPEGYAAALEGLRGRILAAYGVTTPASVVFAASGTDLEYLGLAHAKGRSSIGIRNVLLGADEVGSGCVYSASGQFFAGLTARGVPVAKGEPIGGDLPARVELYNIPVRDDAGRAVSAAEMADAIDRAVAEAHAEGKHTLVHVLHGSKTGLVVPHFEHIDGLRERHGAAVSFIVDACQARITSQAIHAYLARGCIVMLTGSKFMGGPPFSGFALVPQALIDAAAELPRGLAQVFRRAEWPADWPGVGQLDEEANLGLLMRLEASIFELEHFQAIPIARVERVVLAFHAAVRSAFVERLGGRRLAPYEPGALAEGDAHPVEMRTLSTIDLRGLPGAPDFDDAVALHKALVERDVRLGQPVKCVKLPDGRWGATIRVGLSMPQVTAFDRMDDAAMTAKLAADMDRIVAAIEDVRAA
ncbi:hypothetical protein ACLBKU_15690 [Erythrobacter sp. NE805]|uniref:hypothetical protein n=1 Tax=Erythrobacter sp. NE805 TaxID=3389875 RepID=UPI00396B2FB2